MGTNEIFGCPSFLSDSVTGIVDIEFPLPLVIVKWSRIFEESAHFPAFLAHLERIVQLVCYHQLLNVKSN